MKLQFDSNQQYQIDAVNSVVNLFDGQPLNKGVFELGLEEKNGKLFVDSSFIIANNLKLDESEIIKNLHSIQERDRKSVV